MIDQFFEYIEPWSDHLFILAGASIMVITNILFTYHAMRKADHRMHLMLKILHQNLKYFRSFDGRLNLLNSENHKTGLHLNNELASNGAQINGLSSQLHAIESMLNGGRKWTYHTANNAEILFPHSTANSSLKHRTIEPSKISRPFKNYKPSSSNPKSSKLKTMREEAQGFPTEQASIASMEKAARLMEIFRYQTNKDQIRNANHG